MKTEQLCNLLTVEEFKSKDGKKVFHNATFLVGDTTVKCMFIKQADYDILSKLGRLQEVKVVFYIINKGIDTNGVNIYTISLDHVIWNTK